MRGNSLRFFQPSVFIKTFLVFCAIFAAMLSISCKQLASFDPSVDGARVVVNKTFSAPTGLQASQGRKGKISLEWSPVSGARYYDIYCARSATAEFKKIGETDKNSFDDKVSAGSTIYYKVCALKSNDTQSAFSTIVKGTSLAQPVISGGKIDESTATISWFMENARGINNEDNYEEFLKFEVFCVSGSETESKVFYAKEMLSYPSYEYTFDNLAGSTEYTFYVVAYLTKDQQSTEQSPKVNKNTLTSYTPLAPKFNASEGTSAKGVWLYVTLPEMVKVNTVTKNSQNEAVDESYPLYFKVSRAIEGSETYEEVCDLYYNGTEFSTSPVEYKEGGEPYKVGETVAWFDSDTNLQGGVKCVYQIRSVVDTNYSKVVCPEGKEYDKTVCTPDEKASKAVGWKCALPSFKVTSPDKEFKQENGNNVEVLSYEFGFSAEWEDLGKASEYKFAIKQNRKPCDAGDSDSGNDTWLENGENIFFDSLEKINSRKVKFGSESSGLSDDEKGVYSYTLYIVPKSETEVDESKVLVSVLALDTIQVTEDVNLPEALLDVEGGYKNKVVLKISNFKDDVEYKITRTMLEGSEEFNLVDFYKRPDGKYEDTSVQGNCRYSYVLTAKNPSGAWAKSESQEAETLGTPKVSFEKAKLNYDSVTISFNGVLAAKEYAVQIGAGGGFGGGEMFKFAADIADKVTVGNADVSLKGNTYTVTIKNPEGYDNAKLAGTKANVTVTADSGVNGDDGKAKSVPVLVNVLGPAEVGATVDTFEKATEDSITLTWKKVEDAEGYLIRRVMYSDAGMTKVAAESGVTYYCDASGNLVDEDWNLSGRIDLSTKDGIFTLKDIYKETKSTTNAYEKAQAKIFWGLPFQYVVLPVLKSDDFNFDDDSLKPIRNSVTAYTSNFNEIQTAPTATLGYGMEVRAEKSKNTEKQAITWVKPYYASKTTPRVFRRLVDGNGSQGNFTLVEDSTGLVVGADTFTYTPKDNEIYNAYEYLVQYGVVSTPTLKEDLLKDFEERKDADSPTEQANKGYLFTVEDFNLATCNLAAEQGGSNTYAERVTWNTSMQAWDYKVRALGPTGVKLYIQNNNIDDQWHPVAKIGSLDYSGNVEALGSGDDVSAANGTDGISLYPTSCAGGSGATKGFLKVLRDYKHYYALSLTRGDLETQMYTPGFGDFEKISENKDRPKVFAYRQITANEFAIVSAISIADSVYDSNYCSVSESNIGYDRTFVFKDNAKYYLKISGTLYGYAEATGQKPQWYGAVCAGKFGSLNGGKSKPTTLTLTCDNVPLYKGTVTIDSMRNGGGSYIVNYNSQSEDFRSDVSGYFSYK